MVQIARLKVFPVEKEFWSVGGGPAGRGADDPPNFASRVGSPSSTRTRIITRTTAGGPRPRGDDGPFREKNLEQHDTSRGRGSTQFEFEVFHDIIGKISRGLSRSGEQEEQAKVRRGRSTSEGESEEVGGTWSKY